MKNLIVFIFMFVLSFPSWSSQEELLEYVCSKEIQETEDRYMDSTCMENHKMDRKDFELVYTLAQELVQDPEIVSRALEYRQGFKDIEANEPDWFKQNDLKDDLYMRLYLETLPILRSKSYSNNSCRSVKIGKHTVKRYYSKKRGTCYPSSGHEDLPSPRREYTNLWGSKKKDYYKRSESPLLKKPKLKISSHVRFKERRFEASICMTRLESSTFKLSEFRDIEIKPNASTMCVKLTRFFPESYSPGKTKFEANFYNQTDDPTYKVPERHFCSNELAKSVEYLTWKEFSFHKDELCQTNKAPSNISDANRSESLDVQIDSELKSTAPGTSASE